MVNLDIRYKKTKTRRKNNPKALTREGKSGKIFKHMLVYICSHRFKKSKKVKKFGGVFKWQLKDQEKI